MADDREPTYDELKEYALELEQQLEERDQEIADLTQNQAGRKLSRGGGGRGSGNGGQKEELEALEAENDELRSQVEKEQLIVSDLREQLSTANIKIDTLTTEKDKSNKILKDQSKRLDELEKELVAANNRSRSAQEQTKEFNKQKDANVKQAQQLWEENESLKDQIKELESELQSFEEDKAVMQELIAKLADEKDELSAKIERFELEIDELNNARSEVDKELEDAQSRLQASMQSEADLEHKLRQTEANMKALKDVHATELKNIQSESKSLKDQITVLKDTTIVGEKQRALEKAQSEIVDNLNLIEELQQELSSTIRDRNILAEKLTEMETGIEQKVIQRIATEKNRIKELEMTIASMKGHHEDNLEHYSHVEGEKAELMREVDELTNWKAVYEAGHGLQELAREQQKLKKKNQVLTVAVEQFNDKLSMVMDANNVLTQAFDKLKKECGKPADFMYPEYELQYEVHSTNASLKAQLKELEEQVNSLEQENTKLRSTMKNQAASIGEQGFKYAGMTPDMLMVVNEFAANLRDGKTELPLNDRSRELLKENRKLKDDVDDLKLRIERYERELGGSIGGRVAVSPRAGLSADVSSGTIQRDMQRLADENVALQAKMAALQDDLAQLLQRPVQQDGIGATLGQANSTVSPEGMISVSELSRVLTQNNQLMLRELEGIRRAQASNHHGSIDERVEVLPQISSLSGNHFIGTKVSKAEESKYRVEFNQASSVPVVSFAKNQGTPMATTMAARTPSTALWTPGMTRGGGMPFSTPGVPATPHGKQLLQSALGQLNLPPEEWTVEVRDLNSQLIECLEQLYAREQELEDQSAVVATLEENLVGIKQQLTALYYDFAQRIERWDDREETYKKDILALNQERDDLRLKLRRMQDMAELLQRDDKDSINMKLSELTRKVTIFEVNENILSRKYVAQSEQLRQEQTARNQLETDFVEMEASLKKRILYLEQYKIAAGSRIGRLQAKLDISVAQADYKALQSELELLREDHLNTLRREVEARMASLKSLDQARELGSAKIIIAHLQEQVEKAHAAKLSCEAELVHQKEVTTRALAASKSSAEVSNLVSELARFRGEASRLEVELMASNRRADLIGERLQEVSKEAESSALRVKELEQREDDASAKEKAARKQLIELSLKYEGGLTREDADTLKLTLERTQRDLDEAKREMIRHKELAEIASHQAQSLQVFRKQNENELTELREYCSKLESRTDDDLIIGRLQRKLMSVTTSYKAFTRKYQHARECMRKRELAMRVLEGRLEELEKSSVNSQDNYRLELGALKKALRSMKSTVFESAEARQSLAAKSRDNKRLTRMAFAAVPFGEKLVEVSRKVELLTTEAEAATKRAADCEEESRELKSQVEDLLAEKSILNQRLQDLEAIMKGKTKQQAIAARLIALSDDVRVNKIAYLQQRRQVQILRQEKRHLQNIISSIEADVMELEEGKVNADTRRILFDIHEKTGIGMTHNGGPDDDDMLASAIQNLSRDGAADDREVKPTSNKHDATKPIQKSVSPDLLLSMDIISSESNAQNAEHLNDSEELYNKLKTAHAELSGVKKELSENKLKLGSLMNQVASMEALLQERDNQLSYYEHVLQEEGRPGLLLRDGKPRSGLSDVQHLQTRNYHLLHEEQEKLQEAASATIGSLRALLEEKNRIIERYREKLERLNDQHSHASKSRAERRADELLERLHADETEEARARRYGAALHPEIFNGGVGYGSEADRQHYQKLLSQIEQADSIIADKDRLVQQLEQKLLVESNQRDLAEIRCGETIKEMEAMKGDMITLVQQLQESQARSTHLSKTYTTRVSVPPAAHPTGGGPAIDQALATAGIDIGKIKELEKHLKQKDDKVKGYKEIILKLKDEFIKLEQEKAAAEVSVKRISTVDKDNIRGNGISTEEMRQMQEKIAVLKDGLQKSREDVDKARKIKEQLVSENQQLREMLEKLRDENAKCVKLSENAQEGYHRLRKQLEDSRKNEVRLKERIKELNGAEKLRDDLTKYRQRIEHLERENDILQTKVDGLSRKDSSQHNLKSVGESGKELGHVLGAGTGNIDPDRIQLHAKWEAEKKLQKRVGVLEKRLEEKVQENRELQEQLQKGRETLQVALTAKEDMQRRVQQSQRSVAETRKISIEDLNELEQANSKIFTLEEELVRLRRTAHVEQANEINSLNHQVSVQRARIAELEAELAESEMRRKKAASSSFGTGTNSTAKTLREAEDQFLKEERMKDDLDLLKRQKLELEAALLDRDARAMESKFDLEASELEIQRLKRRVKELEMSYKSISSLNKQNQPPKSPATFPSTSGGGGKREQELEGVVEALKRVVEKLKMDNDRLRKGSSGGDGDKRVQDLERKLQQEKKQLEQLQEENKNLLQKMKGHEESSQKVVQRQQQVSALRRQLKSKEDEHTTLHDQYEATVVEKENLKKKNSALQDRINELELAIHKQQGKTTLAQASAKEETTAQLISLQQENKELRDQVEALRKKQISGNNDPRSTAPNTADPNELRRLKEENTKLKNELAAFDLEFFEEIENLKYAHAEATRKLRMYESGRTPSPIGRLGR